MRSPITSRSNCAKESGMLSVDRPIEVVVLNDWVTLTKVTLLRSIGQSWSARRHPPCPRRAHWPAPAGAAASQASVRHRPVPECGRPADAQGTGGYRVAVRSRRDRAISVSAPRSARFSGRPVGPIRSRSIRASMRRRKTVGMTALVASTVERTLSAVRR